MLYGDRVQQQITPSGTGVLEIGMPAEGYSVRIKVGNFSGTIVGRNGSDIMGAAQDLTPDIPYSTTTLQYESVHGWMIV